MSIGESREVRRSGANYIRGIIEPFRKYLIWAEASLVGVSSESGRVRRGYITVFWLVWDIPVIAVDARFGGCWCLRKDLGRSDCPTLVGEYPPYLGRSKYVHHRNSSGKASEVGGNRAWWIPESGKLDPGITSPVDKPVREILPARLKTGPGNGSLSGSLTY